MTREEIELRLTTLRESRTEIYRSVQDMRVSANETANAETRMRKINSEIKDLEKQLGKLRKADG